ncbi:MAG TPA: hypothetical protein VH600_23460 [Burkholderiales bacterium]|jgi:Spy/CpxP family protein refolding chaperone
MREHIKPFLLTSSLAFCIPTGLDLTEAQREQISQILHEARALSDTALTRAETLRRVTAVLSPEQPEKLALFQSESKVLRDFTLG